MRKPQSGEHNDHEIAKGMAAGLLGGLAASLAMNLAMSAAARVTESRTRGAHDPQRDKQSIRMRVRRFQQMADPTGEFSNRAWRKVTGRSLSRAQKRKAGPVVHYAFGAVAGAVYGALAEVAPITTAGAGTAYGLAIWAAGDEVAVPALGLAPGPMDVPPRAHAAMFGSHVIYGLVLEGVRRLIRRERDEIDETWAEGAYMQEAWVP